MMMPRRIQSFLLPAATALTLALTAGCRHASPLGYVPREGKFEKPVLAAMARAAKTNGFVNVVATFGSQLGDAEKRRVLLAVKAATQADGGRAQRQALIEALKSVSLQSQMPVLARLREWEKQGAIRAVRPLWIANAIVAEVSPTVISNLASFDQLISLHLDLPSPLTPQAAPAPAGRGAQPATPNPPGPGPSQDVLVAVLDSGVDWHHRDLTNRIWINPGEFPGDGMDNDGNRYADDLRGWNFSADSSDPDDTNGHGTHVAGIIAGDGSGGGPRGVAPQARIMALRRTDESNRSTERECWEAMQYALENGARILNFSSGWLGSHSPDYYLWRTMIQNLMDAGVLVVTGAGNFGNVAWCKVPDQVLTPGRVPVALTVGWSVGSSSNSQKSSRGPVTWQLIEGHRDYPYPPGLIKPDLVAPGENIQSTKAGGGYTQMSGTSMAAPHVAGAAALLLGQNPGLNPYELRYLL